jgi:lysophospholipase L1-like esterase
MRFHHDRLIALVALAAIAMAPSAAQARLRGPGGPHIYYLSVGTSLAVGLQPNPDGHARRTKGGYADQLVDDLEEAGASGLKLVKLGCSGETSATILTGGLCEYPRGGSQLDEAEAFLLAHQDQVALVTVDLGANDIEPCGSPAGIDQACVAQAVASVASNLPVVLARLRAAAGPDVPIVGMNYYNPFLAAWFVNPALALASDAGLVAFNGLLAAIYGAFAIPVADVAAAFQASDFTPVAAAGGVPLNVLLVCQWTWMCSPGPAGPNIHANAEGYQQIADAFLDVLVP